MPWVGTVPALPDWPYGLGVGKAVALLEGTRWAFVGAPGVPMPKTEHGVPTPNAPYDEGFVYKIDVELELPTSVVSPPESTPLWHGEFGDALAASMPFLLIGAPGVDRSTGRVYQYQIAETEDASSGEFGDAVAGQHEPVFVRTLEMPTPATELARAEARGSHFGSSMAIRGTRAIIGARGSDSYPGGSWKPSDNGYVFVFDLLSGNQTARLAPVDPHNEWQSACFWL